MYGSQPRSRFYNVQHILVVAYEFIGAVRGFMINLLCGLGRVA